MGDQDDAAKVLKGFGDGAARAGSVVLRCFQKKSKRGIATPKADMDMDIIRARLTIAEALAQERRHEGTDG